MFRFQRLAIGIYWTDAPGDKLDIDAMLRDRCRERWERMHRHEMQASAQPIVDMMRSVMKCRTSTSDTPPIV